MTKLESNLPRFYPYEALYLPMCCTCRSSFKPGQKGYRAQGYHVAHHHCGVVYSNNRHYLCQPCYDRAVVEYAAIEAAKEE